MPLQVTATDNIHPRNVELLVNGKVVQNAVTYPFDLSVALPTIAQNGSDLVTIQVLAYDTGGNVGSSGVFTVELVEDGTPALLASNLADGSRQPQNLGPVAFKFSKPLDPSTVTASTFQLTGPNGAVMPLAIDSTVDSSVQFTYPTLAQGSYQLTIDAPDITDPAGVALAPLPSPAVHGHAVLDDVDQSQRRRLVRRRQLAQRRAARSHRRRADRRARQPHHYLQHGERRVHSILAYDPLQITGGTLEVDSTLDAEGGLLMDGGTLERATLLAGFARPC